MDQKATEFGIYDQLMMELRNEDSASFTNFLCMHQDMSEELLDRVGPRITRCIHGTGSPSAWPEAFPGRTPTLHLGTSL